jgi:hypothetical protein
MDEAGISYVLQSERMGHEVPGMHGVYSHISERMRKGVVSALQEFWEESAGGAGSAGNPRSAVGVLDALLTSRTPSPRRWIGSEAN